MIDQLKLFLLVLIVALAAAGSIQATSDGQSSVESREIAQDSARSRFTMANLFNFQQYQETFGKHYKSILEKAMRAKIYLARAFRTFISMIAYKHHKGSMYLSVNPMSDWTPAKIDNILMRDKTLIANKDTSSDSDIGSDTIQTEPILAKMIGPTGGNFQGQQSSVSSRDMIDTSATSSSTTLPDASFIDHRNCLPEVEWQRSCGCCYAFATMALYEWLYCRAKNKLINFSKQYVIDCGDPNRVLYGCNGGSPNAVRDYVIENGLLREEEYEYKAMKNECLYSAETSADSRGSVRIYEDGAEVMSLATIGDKLKIAPLVMIAKYDRNCIKLIEYGGGVDNDIDCSGSLDETHAMLLVGSGREDGHEYFLLRNSFGPHWDEKGYYKLNKRHGSIIDNAG